MSDPRKVLRILLFGISGAVFFGCVSLKPFMCLGWFVGAYFFGGGTFGGPSGIRVYVGMVATPIFGGAVGILIGWVLINRHEACPCRFAFTTRLSLPCQRSADGRPRPQPAARGR